MLKRLPTGESSFEKIRAGDQLYVDKTRQLYELLCSGDYFFLSRPRRFGKSLMVSTLKALFEGREDLFEGLWIHERWDWAKKNPVLALSFNAIDYRTNGLEQALSLELEKVASASGLSLAGLSAKDKFRELILSLASGGAVAVLIDEYDKPINDFLDDYAQADANRGVLANFFGALKAHDVVDHLRFVFITGVSKFSKVTLFSELNNLTDLTHHDSFSTLLGITQAELEHYFDGYIGRLSGKMGLDREALLAKIKHWYNGYTWDGRHFLYNPFSLLGLFGSSAFKNFWFTTGTTSWLVRKLRDSATNIARIEDLVVGESFFDKFEVRNMDPTVLLYQTGYLTIKEQIEESPALYRLGYPNHEVRSSLIDSLFQAYAATQVSEVGLVMQQIRASLLEHDLPRFIALLRGIFADISNRLLKQYVEGDSLKLWEAYYQTVIYLALNLTGSQVACEVQTNKGYIDAVAETAGHIYVMEFKVGKAAEAMQQIKDKGYAEKYLHRGKPVTLLGVGFDPETRNIGDWVEEVVAA